MNELSSTKLLNAIRKLNTPKDENNLIFGTVKSVDPLKIEIQNGLILTKEFLFLGQMCRPHKVTIPHTHKYSGKTEESKATPSVVPTTPGGGLTFVGQGKLEEPKGHIHNIKDQETDDVHKEGCGTDYEESVTIEIEPKLKEGDKVLMFAFNNHQMFYVAERLEEE